MEKLYALAECLGVPKDDSIESMLRACANLMEQRLSEKAIQQYQREKVRSRPKPSVSSVNVEFVPMSLLPLLWKQLAGTMVDLS